MSIDVVLFDLDGTLADTAPDLVAVLNRQLREHGKAPLPYALARNVVSNGAAGLIRLGFRLTPSVPVDAALHARFLELYGQNLCINSKLFIALTTLSDIGSRFRARWGIVTNKPASLTRPLIAALGLAGAATVVCGDSLPQKKPHPAPLQLAAREAGAPPERCIYVGDAPRDIDAGRAAGMRTIAAAYGYLRPEDDPRGWGADALIGHPGELMGILAAMGEQS